MRYVGVYRSVQQCFVSENSLFSVSGEQAKIHSSQLFKEETDFSATLVK